MRPPTLHMLLLIDRTSFEETDDFSIAPEAVFESSSSSSSSSSYEPQSSFQKIKHGKVRRKMRWRIPQKEKNHHHVIESSCEQQPMRRRSRRPTSPHRKRPYYTDRFSPIEESIEKPYEELSPKMTIFHEKDDDDYSSSLDEIRLKLSKHHHHQHHHHHHHHREECCEESPHAATTSAPFLQVEQNLQAIHDMASEHLRQGEYEEALEVFEEILRGLGTRYGEEHKRVGTAYHNRGIVQMRMGHYEAAIQSYQEAIRIRKATLGEDHANVAVSLAQLGVVHLERHQPRKALVAFREALHIRRQWYDNDHPKVAKILHNIGCCLYKLKELEMAKVAWEEALKIQRVALKSTAPEVPLLGIAATQWNLASLQLSEGAYDDAALTLDEVLLVQECVLSEQDPLVQQTRDTLEWLNQQQSSVMMDFQRRLMAMRDLACGAADPQGLASDDDSSIAGP
ncbi:kinesin light chain [Fistulifera solaris]|uniref:Kinesin light chain n=1 Tax=Fistulifera solaris TaxID=1519565 RepID=A0A1Z5KEG0_FISSO|nr:kinesin light chain [Fistulifera solaris]|eukprot:GAX24515.1 kinesin light chain [Fistulifera solaris]